MSDAVLIYPHQLFEEMLAARPAFRVFLVEEPLLLTHNPVHRAKLVFHKLSMDAYQAKLEEAGHQVTRLAIGDHPRTEDIFNRLKREGVRRIHVADTTDNYLEKALARSGLDRIWRPSPLFILERDEAKTRFVGARRFMASFYKDLRKDKKVLVDREGAPTGGKWSFDHENRRKIPKNIVLPQDIVLNDNGALQDAAAWAAGLEAEQYGQAASWLPHTHEGARTFLKSFLQERFCDFGPYEDAMTTRGVRLWHSALSPLLNVGLLTPQQVLDEALNHADRHDIPLNSLEGFVRQILGWREFIRASYEVDGAKMRNGNFWKHNRKLPTMFWTGETGIDPVDHVIATAHTYGYNHHIERLMVMGNFMLLSKIHPGDVYRWFMGMYVDAYDWVMVPNVYGMSQFADGGGFATKPYISGANYIRKMSDHRRGDWEEIWTALYWNFINDHIDVFKNNHRLSMMPRMLAKMNEGTRNRHFKLAREYLSQ